jgi:hypothetical protein
VAQGWSSARFLPYCSSDCESARSLESLPWSRQARISIFRKQAEELPGSIALYGKEACHAYAPSPRINLHKYCSRSWQVRAWHAGGLAPDRLSCTLVAVLRPIDGRRGDPGKAEIHRNQV